MKRCGHKLTTGTILKVGDSRIWIRVCDVCKTTRIEIKQEIEIPTETFVTDWNQAMKGLKKWT
jgi:hypothetical protein